MKHDFGGYATKNDVKCSDGRTILRDAFKDNDGSIVPLVWMHQHDDPMNVLGHARLENRKDGVYAYCYLNDSEQAKHAKELVKHGDISAMSIFANRLKQDGGNVHHGVIREVSLVMAGANPGAFIEENSFEHTDGTTQYLADGEAVIYNDNPLNVVIHSDSDDESDSDEVEKTEEIKESDESIEHADDAKEENQNGSSDETIEDIFKTIPDDTKEIIYTIIGSVAEGEDIDEDMVEPAKKAIESLNEKQRTVVEYMIGQAAEGSDDEDVEHSDEKEEEEIMKHNIFDSETDNDTLIHAEDMKAALADGEKFGSMRASFIEHGIDDIEILFPEAKTLTPTPDMITRPMGWVTEVLNATRKSPFSRIKSVAANLTKDEARAKGYIKGKKKIEQQFGLLKRVTTPQTIYKKQALDRDDIIDITDFDVVAFIKSDLKMMIDEETARAILVGDGRAVGEEDKISEEHIRPIYQDDDVYTIHYSIDDLDKTTDENDRSNLLVDSAVRSRKDYRGSGSPVLYASTDVINDMLLSRDKNGRRMYANEQDLAAALRVSKIVEVPVFEGITRTDEESKDKFELLGLIVNLGDYTIGADKGGELNFFDDFDIDFNKEKYLMETRISGCLTKPYSAIALEKPFSTSPDTPEEPEEPEEPDEPNALG